MEFTTMGKVVVPARVENLGDLYAVEQETLPADQVRSVEVTDGLVDTGATMFSLPTSLVDSLGLKRRRSHRFATTSGVRQGNICEPVRLTIQGRDCIVEVAEVPDDCPVLIGQLPLEALDFVVDPVGQRLIGNPAHDGERMVDLFFCHATDP